MSKIDWVDIAAQSMQAEIDREILAGIFESTISNKLRFTLRLKGLTFGGVLENWGITIGSEGDKPYNNIGHMESIVPNLHHICYRLPQPASTNMHRSLRFTDVIRAHYPDEYVVTTDEEYFYLGERAFTHDNMILRQEYVDRWGDRVIFALVDAGVRGNTPKVVLKTEVGARILESSNIEYERMIKDDMLKQYKEIIRRGC